MTTKDRPARSGLLANPAGVQKWLGRGFWAISDQGLFATSNFLLNVLLARWLDPKGYGAFALAYSIFLLLGTVHTALLTEPMLVFAPGRYRDRFRTYLETVLNGHWKLSSILVLALVLTAVVMLAAGSQPVGSALLALAIAAPFILLQWLMRRACYARLEPRTAAIAGLGYAVWLITGAYALYRWQELSAFSALILMGLGSLFAAAWLSRRVNVRLMSAGLRSLESEVRRDHWTYGRWAVGTGALGWVPSNVYYVLLPIWGGLEATGALRALFNILSPVIQANAALGLVLLPALVGVRGTSVFKSRLMAAGAIFMVTAVGYWVLLGLFHEPLLHWLYRGKYDEYNLALVVLGALGVSSAFVSVASTALRSLERPDRVFWSYVLSSIVAIVLGVPLIVQLGVFGAALALTISSIAAAVALAWFLWRAQATGLPERPAA
jgi:O-antigen/teichoic acid export membrane protein